MLRILRGSHPDGLPCGEVGDRMVTPLPDVTRLLDRLAERRLVARDRDPGDRRVVVARITERGRDRLADLDQPLADWLEQSLGDLAAADLERLIGLLERLRE